MIKEECSDVFQHCTSGKASKKEFWSSRVTQCIRIKVLRTTFACRLYMHVINTVINKTLVFVFETEVFGKFESVGSILKTWIFFLIVNKLILAIIAKDKNIAQREKITKGARIFIRLRQKKILNLEICWLSKRQSSEASNWGKIVRK